MNYFKFKDALISKKAVEDGYKYTVTVNGKDIAAGSVQGLVKVLNEIYKMPKTDILDELFKYDFEEFGLQPVSYSGKIKAANYAYDHKNIFYIKALADSVVTFESLYSRGFEGSVEPTIHPVLYVSKDKNIDYNKWTEWDYSGISLAEGEKLYIYGENPDGFQDVDLASWSFVSTGKFEVGGNIKSLLSLNYADIQDLPEYALQAIFMQTLVVSAKDLVIECRTVNRDSLNAIFMNCSELKYGVPVIKAEYVYYEGLTGFYSDCSYLETTTKIESLKKVSDYQSLFNFYRRCVSLTGTIELPNVEFEEGSDRSFGQFIYGCTGLTKLVIPAQTGGESATNAYRLIATTSSISEVVIETEKLGSSALYRAFRNAPNLSKVTLYATEFASDAFTQWLDGTAGGTLYVKEGVELPEGAVPANWTVERF